MVARLPLIGPIEAALAPLKAAAQDRAEQAAREWIARTEEGLKAAGFDLKVYAPYPEGRLSREQYLKALRFHDRVLMVTRHLASSIRMSEPELVRMDDERIARYVAACREAAGMQYEAFVEKMIHKIGRCDSASIHGSHVWGFSILTIKKGEAVEHWKTQQIINVSKLGLLFNQWPSRQVKG